MRFRNLTRRREIGANSYLLEAGDERIIIDSGMHPKQAGNDALPDINSVPFDKANALLLSHAHHDHIGSLAVTQRRHPNAPVYMTEATGEIGSAMLHNSVNVMTKQREELGINEYPFFTHRELDQIRPLWSYQPINKRFGLANTSMDCTFHDAGHIIGSTGISIHENGKTFFYTGDVCFENQTISMAADFPKSNVDVMLMETTRGDFARPAEYSRKSEKEKLAALIRDTWAAGGSVLIPVFALGKTQEVLLMLHELHQLDLIPEMPLFMGGLSTKITVLYDQYSSKVRRNYAGFSLLDDIEILVASRRKKREITYQSRCIYALSSGMMSENTTSNVFAAKFLDNPRNSVAFVGYTDIDSPGYKVRHAKPGEKVTLDKRLPPVQVNCRIESFDFSAHATRETLLDYVKEVKPGKVILVHGDAPAQNWFEREINAALPNTEVMRPEPGANVDLW